MARRKSKAKPRSRTAKNVNILNIAESALLANAVTQGLFNSNLKDFVMGTQNGVYKAGIDGGDRLTLPEILRRIGSVHLAVIMDLLQWDLKTFLPRL
jgi:hypothetical protein